jgi:hypothetical protein
MAASGYQRPASPLNIFGSGLTFCSEPKTGCCEIQSGGRSNPRWVRPAGRLPVTFSPGARTERLSNYHNNHLYHKGKGLKKFILKKSGGL